ncbi:Hint domain-containing protein [Tropicimonas sp. TH_r6]|uniref:Hint domain-containing protein n=1 Tax=Tropicimonas sp. TH_r6 TaxID=3082085 RepID=UPI002954D95B|nr:Hint domain-containing protein [Tropicimonas sp. TH_r6]MDV7144962.1 Hint domain-containing protein [Tropicimonas sp. TH_r6]
MSNIILDFNDLATGAVVSDQYADKGVTISTSNVCNPAMIFDTANPTGGDTDLASDTAGNVLIISEDGDSSDPDDNASGGTITFEFDSAAHVQSLNLLDFEQGGTITCYDENGDVLKMIDLPSTANGGSCLVDIDCEGVYVMEVTNPISGAIDDLAFSIDRPGDPDGIVEGTENDDFISLGYTGDPEGDTIDGGDAILPGEAADDDIVWAGAGDDEVYGGADDDEIWGDRAQVEKDTVTITLGEGTTVSYANKLFVYTIDPDTGEITNLEMLSSNTLHESGNTYEYEVSPGDIVGIGIISPEGTFLSSGYGDNVDLNSDGREHTELVGIDPTSGAVTIAFEDQSGCGGDFNDVVVSVDLGASGASFDNAHVDYSSDAVGYDDSAEGDDILDGGAGDDEIYGGGGNDTITGGDGSDTVDGGDGNDVIDTSSTGDAFPDLGFEYPRTPVIPADRDTTDDMDTVLGGAGNDTITTGDDADYIDGGDGDDMIDGGLDADTILGGEGADTIIGGEGSDDIDGGAGDDVIYGGLGFGYEFDPLNIKDDGTDTYGADPVQDNGMDVIRGGDGNDTIYGQDDDDTIFGDAGNDFIDGGIDEDIISGGTGEDVILGGQGDDHIEGGADTDLILGGEGDDRILGDAGRDLIGGGDGNDVIDGGDDGDILFGDKGDDVISGGEGSDVIVGGEGADTQSGDAGDDLFVGVAEGDHIDGGDGEDTMVLSGPAIIEYDDPTDPTSGTISFLDFGSETPVSTATFENTENISYVIPEPEPVAATGAETATREVTDLPDITSDLIVDGTSGDDIMDSSYVDAEGDQIDDGVSLPGLGGYDDVVRGYAGQDVIESGLGNDYVLAGSGDDDVDGGAGNDIIRGEEGNDALAGGDGDDQLRGDEGVDLLEGGEGNDVLVGGSGQDELIGGAGNDVLVGGDADAVDSTTNDNSADTLVAGEGKDVLYGDGGADSLSLGDDTDVDVAFGGADADTFFQVGPGDVVFGGEAGDDNDTIDLTGYANPLTVNWTNGDPTTESGTVTFYEADGTTVAGIATFSEIENVIPCFTPGTRVATPSGEKLVEEICVGDEIITRDNGVQEVRWSGRKALDYGKLSKVPHLQPILIPAGSLGDDLPERDMLVSPNHRMLVADDRTSLYFAEHEVLVAAKHLVGRHGIRRLPQLQTTYIHFMFDCHEVVLADGAWTESFQPGDYTLNGIDSAQRDEILELFPDLGRQNGRDDYVAARRTLKRHEAVLLQQ